MRTVISVQQRARDARSRADISHSGDDGSEHGIGDSVIAAVEKRPSPSRMRERQCAQTRTEELKRHAGELRAAIAAE